MFDGKIMRILWLCNVVPPMIAEKLNIATTVKEGWIDASLRKLLGEKDNSFEMGICVPGEVDGPFEKKEVNFDNAGINVYRFLENTKCPWVYDKSLENVFAGIIADFKPDIVHIFGTEYPHTLACVRAMKDPSKVLIGIQGVMVDYAAEYSMGIPKEIIDKSTFRDFLKGDNIAKQKRKYELRAEMERKAISLAGNVTGRTDFDRNAAYRENKDIRYYHMFETLRREFYEGDWNPDNLKNHTIFVSQCDYPIKGFHVLLEALPRIVEKYPDARVRIAGNGITGYDSFKKKLKIGTYGKYCRELMEKYNLEDRIQSLGMLDAKAMRDEYLAASVYVCPSILENSPNSMGEAMLLGTPVVASRSGGVPSMIEEGKEALLFDQADSNSLAECVIRMWEDAELAVSLSEAAKKRGRKNHNPDENYHRLLEIYNSVYGENINENNNDQ